MLSRSEMLRNSSRSSLPAMPSVKRDEGLSTFSILAQFATCLIPNFVIRKLGGMEGAQIQAWREKITLCMMIAMNCLVLGFLTYGINKWVCTGNEDMMVFGQLKRKAFKKKKGIILGNGGIYYSDDDDYGFKLNTHKFSKESSACEDAFGDQLVDGDIEEEDVMRIYDLYFTFEDVRRNGLIIIDENVYDPKHCKEKYFSKFIAKYKGGVADGSELKPSCLACFKDSFLAGQVFAKSPGCVFADILFWLSTVVIFSLILIRFFLAMFYAWYAKTRPVAIRGTTPVILQVTCYSEGEAGLRSTLDSLTQLEYDEDYKLIVVVADGEIKGQGEKEVTPEILQRICTVDSSEPLSYISLVSGHKRYNRATIHGGYYEKDGKRSKVLLINKCGNPAETARRGNRGKRDSQVIIMSFFSKLFYNERMSDLDRAMYRKIAELLPRIRPEDFELLLMVDADTVVERTALTKMVSAFEHDPKIMGLCGETQIVNKTESWVTWIQVFEYYISHHLTKNFESVFGGVTCLPGCFCIYRIKITTDEYGNIKNHADRKLFENEQWECVPILANPLIVNSYSVYEARTLHEKNLLHLGEDRYLTTLLMKNFFKRKLVFVASAKCYTCVPADYATLRSQRRRWINSTIHNMFELVVVDKLCGTFCCSMQFIIFFELFGTLTLPAAIFFTFVLLIVSIIGQPAWIPLIMLVGILGLPAVLIMFTTFELSYWFWLIIYIFALPIWNFMLPVYAFWKFDDFSWGDTRKIEGGSAADEEGEFDPASVRLLHLNDPDEVLEETA